MVDVSVPHSVNSFPSKVATDRVPAGMDLRKITTPILFPLLRRDMRFPTLFLIRCKLTVGRLKRRTDPSFPRALTDIPALPLWGSVHLNYKLAHRRASEGRRIAIRPGA